LQLLGYEKRFHTAWTRNGPRPDQVLGQSLANSHSPFGREMLV
jgi:hypothetical protein